MESRAGDGGLETEEEKEDGLGRTPTSIEGSVRAQKNSPGMDLAFFYIHR